MAAPKHVGVIMDGNRRLSRRIARNPFKGHEWGKEKLREVIDWCYELGIKELTTYAFSIQNFNRPKQEFDHIMRIFKEAADELINKKEEMAEKGLRIRFIGRKQMLPGFVRDSIIALEEATAGNKPYKLNIAMAYGGREELLDAVKEIVSEVEKGAIDSDQVTAELIEEHLYLDSEPDMIIRTGGERRTSNFLIWQSWYSEWFFTDKMWPEFSKEDFTGFVEEYSNRERRRGR